MSRLKKIIQGRVRGNVGEFFTILLETNISFASHGHA